MFNNENLIFFILFEIFLSWSCVGQFVYNFSSMINILQFQVFFIFIIGLHSKLESSP